MRRPAWTQHPKAQHRSPNLRLNRQASGWRAKGFSCWPQTARESLSCCPPGLIDIATVHGRQGPEIGSPMASRKSNLPRPGAAFRSTSHDESLNPNVRESCRTAGVRCSLMGAGPAGTTS